MRIISTTALFLLAIAAGACGSSHDGNTEQAGSTKEQALRHALSDSPVSLSAAIEQATSKLPGNITGAALDVNCGNVVFGVSVAGTEDASEPTSAPATGVAGGEEPTSAPAAGTEDAGEPTSELAPATVDASEATSASSLAEGTTAAVLLQAIDIAEKATSGVAIEVSFADEKSTVVVLGEDATYELLVSSDGNVVSTVEADLGPVEACLADGPTSAPAEAGQLPPTSAPADTETTLPATSEAAK